MIYKYVRDGVGRQTTLPVAMKCKMHAWPHYTGSWYGSSPSNHAANRAEAQSHSMQGTGKGAGAPLLWGTAKPGQQTRHKDAGWGGDPREMGCTQCCLAQRIRALEGEQPQSWGAARKERRERGRIRCSSSHSNKSFTAA